MNIIIKQGALSVIQSGTLIVSNNETTSFLLDNTYNISIVFKDDISDTNQAITPKSIKNGVEIELKNFNNPLGTSTKKPIPLASRNDDTVYLSLCVTAIGTTKILAYSIYLGKE